MNAIMLALTEADYTLTPPVHGPQLPRPIIDAFPEYILPLEQRWWVVVVGREVGVCFGE